MDEFFQKIPLRDTLTGWSIMVGPILLLLALGLVFLRAEPIERASVFGCYLAEGAPWLEIDRDRIRIGEAERRMFSYSAEPAKDGYRLSVQPALDLSALGDGHYDFKHVRGSGYFWPLLTQSSDRPERMRHPSDFGGRFRILADDGAAIIYTRSSNQQACG